MTGDPVDEAGPIEADQRWPIHREPPTFEEQETDADILVTGIKVLDLLCPFLKGGKIGLFGGAWVSIMGSAVRDPEPFSSLSLQALSRSLL